jgi:hypothetical protein
MAMRSDSVEVYMTEEAGDRLGEWREGAIRRRSDEGDEEDIRGWGIMGDVISPHQGGICDGRFCW